MATALQMSVWSDLDFLLTKITEDLQLTPTQFQNAVDKYAAVAAWLQAPGSALAALHPEIYPQGSMALRTTLRPRDRVEYDLDLVCETLPTGFSAMQLYDLLFARLHENGQYRPIVEKLKRCVRLNYAGEFHLDVIPARPDSMRPPSIFVPDRRLKAWTPSNPRGFIGWFESRARQLKLAEGRAAVPLPPPLPAEARTNLAVAVQLIKRRRDMIFNGDDNAPRSVLLTTLAGHSYQGEGHVAEATYRIMARIQALIHAAAPGRIEVRNPTNADESFTEAFTDTSYKAFASFVTTFTSEMEALLEITGGLPALHGQLGTMFGDRPVSTAYRAMAELTTSRRNDGLRFGAGAGLSIVSSHDAPHPVPRTNFYGDE